MRTRDSRTEKDFWIEMSIREIWTQAHFAELAYRNVDPKAMGGTDAVFSSIHSFLSHCAIVSKMLKATDRKISEKRLLKVFDRCLVLFGLRKNPVAVGSILGIEDSSIIHKRKFRNHLEHYDERLKQWVEKFAAGANIGTYNVGPKPAFQAPNMIFVNHYDPSGRIFTFVNEDFDLGALYEEVSKIKGIADTWVKATQSGTISPPFDRVVVSLGVPL